MGVTGSIKISKIEQRRFCPAGLVLCIQPVVGCDKVDVTVAVNDRRKTASGDWIEEATFVDVTLWGRNAEVASEYLSKGSPVLIEGRLKLDRWETEGQKRSKLRVICEKMQMLSARTGGGGPSSHSEHRGASGQTAEDAGNYDSPPSQDYSGGSNTGGSNMGGSNAGGSNTGNPGVRDAQPTGGGAGYEDPNIPF